LQICLEEAAVAVDQIKNMVQEVLGLVQAVGRTIAREVIVETELKRADHDFEREQDSRFVLGRLRTVCSIGSH